MPVLNTYLRVYARQRPGGMAWDAVPLTVRGLNKAAGTEPAFYCTIYIFTKYNTSSNKQHCIMIIFKIINCVILYTGIIAYELQYSTQHSVICRTIMILSTI